MQRAQTLEAELALLLRIGHKYGKSGAQVIFSMGALEHIASCRAVNFFVSIDYVLLCVISCIPFTSHSSNSYY